MDKMDKAQEIERKHFGRCLWQAIIEPRRDIMVECMDYPKARTTAIVIKHFEGKIPRPTAKNRKWPALLATYVYLPTDDRSNTWDGLDAALTEFEAKNQAADDAVTTILHGEEKR